MQRITKRTSTRENPKDRVRIARAVSVRALRTLKRPPITDLEIHAMLEKSAARDPGVEIGIGSDVAVVRGGRERIAIKTDPTIEGIHFARGYANARLIVRKALARPCSDFAAAGVMPQFALTSVVFPSEADRRFITNIVRALRTECASLGLALAGGHTAFQRSAPLALHVTIVGVARTAEISRKGAAPGDAILATGSFGGAGVRKHLAPPPRFQAMARLARMVNIRAAIDVSDGLALDLHRLARASNIAIELDAASIPISGDARKIAKTTGRSPLSHALADGEDYEVVFSVRSRDADRAIRSAARLRLPVARVGRALAGSGVYLISGAERAPLEPAGFVQRCDR